MRRDYTPVATPRNWGFAASSRRGCDSRVSKERNTGSSGVSGNREVESTRASCGSARSLVYSIALTDAVFTKDDFSCFYGLEHLLPNI
jgi:hypothetical protein